MHEQSHTIIRLSVHLPEQQPVYFQEGHEQAALDRAALQSTHLTAWFKLNQQSETAHQHLYTQISTHFVFHQQREWKPRKRGGNKVITRMYSVRPKDAERYYLRMLLLHVPGATSFDDLRTVDGRTVPTFQEACKLRHLLDDDSEWDPAMTEASAFQMPSQLRVLFATICSHSEPHNPLQLWLQHKECMVEDYERSLPAAEAEARALQDIQAILSQSGTYNLQPHYAVHFTPT